MKVSSKTIKNYSRYLGLCVIMVKTYIHLAKSSVISQLGQDLFDF